MRLVATPGATLEGAVRVPGDKSISHRAVMFGSMAQGVTEVAGLLMGTDVLATVEAFRKMGVEVDLDETQCTIFGSGMCLREGDIIDVGNSGTTMRLLLGILAGAGICQTLTGDSSILRRPMGRVVEPLSAMGAHIHGRQNGKYAPLTVCPAELQGMHHNIPMASAQVKSALLLAGLQASGETSVTEPAQSRDHTERMLEAFGVLCTKSEQSLKTKIHGQQKLQGTKVQVPGDISSAAFPMVAALLGSVNGVCIENVGLNETRTGIIDIIRDMAGSLSIIKVDSNSEPAGSLELSQTDELRSTTIEGTIIPRLIDEIPVLAFLSAFATGTTEIRNAGELRVKESDRVSTVANALRQGGAVVTELSDGLVVEGNGPKWRFRGGTYDSHNDHRLAMSLAVAALRADGPVVVENADCIMTSFPGFVELMNSLSNSGKPWLTIK